jgi:hypothetical protein
MDKDISRSCYICMNEQFSDENFIDGCDCKTSRICKNCFITRYKSKIENKIETSCELCKYKYVFKQQTIKENCCISIDNRNSVEIESTENHYDINITLVLQVVSTIIHILRIALYACTVWLLYNNVSINFLAGLVILTAVVTLLLTVTFTCYAKKKSQKSFLILWYKRQILYMVITDLITLTIFLFLTFPFVILIGTACNILISSIFLIVITRITHVLFILQHEKYKLTII